MNPQQMNQRMIEGHVGSAIRMIKMANGELASANRIAPFSNDSKQELDIKTAIGDLDHALEKLTTPPQQPVAPVIPERVTVIPSTSTPSAPTEEKP